MKWSNWSDVNVSVAITVPPFRSNVSPKRRAISALYGWATS